MSVLFFERKVFHRIFSDHRLWWPLDDSKVLSEWSELTSANCPRFLYEKKVDLPLSLNAVDFYSEKGFKLSFALDNMRSSPSSSSSFFNMKGWYWIESLTSFQISITFHLSQQRRRHSPQKHQLCPYLFRGWHNRRPIRSRMSVFMNPLFLLSLGLKESLTCFSHPMVCSDQKARVIAKKPLSLRFTWEEYSEQHVTVGTGVLLFAGFLITYLLVGYSLLSFYLTLKPSLSVDQRLPTKLVSKSNWLGSFFVTSNVNNRALSHFKCKL